MVWECLTVFLPHYVVGVCLLSEELRDIAERGKLVFFMATPHFVCILILKIQGNLISEWTEYFCTQRAMENPG